MRIFAGHEAAYGLYDTSKPKIREDGKVTGSAVTRHGVVTEEMWEQHLAGKGPGLGIIPIRTDSSCYFGAIDVDVYTGLQHQTIVAKLARLRIPMIVCRSKSGGAHLYLFAKEPVPARILRRKLAEISTVMGFGDCELFPKQDHADIGNWISIDYFGGTRGMRYAVDIEGNALSPEQFVQRVELSSVGLGWFDEKILVGDDFADGPPCLQALAQVGYPPGTRNDGLYNIGVYLKKAKPDTWEDGLNQFNYQFMQPPLLVIEVSAIVKSLKKKDYQYGCSKQPISAHCNSAVCRTRKFGVGGGTAGRFPTLGGLVKLQTDPPSWFWFLEGRKVELTTVELQDPKAFQRRCIQSLNMMPPVPNANAWRDIVQRALDSVTIIEAPPDASPEGQFWEYVEKFCTGRSQALSLKEITLCKPFTEGGRTYFRMCDLIDYLTRHKFTEYKAPKIASLLNAVNAKHHGKNLNGSFVNYWSLVEFPKGTEPLEVPAEIGESSEAF
jgi:hypothetical protein